MKPELQPEEQEYELPGQMAFFPELETDDPAPHILLQRPIDPPELSQLEPWRLSILLSDILCRFEGRLPEAWLYEIFVGNGFLSHFEYTNALGALLDSGAAVSMTDADGQEILTLTAGGIQNAKNLRRMVPKIFRDSVHLKAMRFCARQKALRDLKISYEPDENGCELCLRCMDGAKEMIFLRIATPGQAAAEELSERILRNPARFFGKIIDLAMTNEEETIDLTDN